ncbi:lipid phosphate phosphatase [Acrasis kona]|uniref:Lipid phosphate phosphatase n=1 Tax=Acrasis kona TaxID=1008807 RepID=A0AAW2ZB29_9EUKA
MYVTDWVMIIIMSVINQVVFGQSPGLIKPYIRHNVYRFIDDASVSYPSLPSIVPTWVVGLLITILPTLIFIIVFYYQRSTHDLHHALLGLGESIVITMTVTDIFKILAGRLRPNFLARCLPDAAGDCSQVGSTVRDARLSFPSGHSSMSFAGMIFLSLYLTGKLRTFSREGGSLWKALVCLFPMFIAGMVAVSRTLDYHHNYDDIIAGTLIGCFIGLVCYHLQYPSLFDEKCHKPKNRYHSISASSNKHEGRLPPL